MRSCRAETEVDKLAEALREQSRIHAPDLKNKLLAEKLQSDAVKRRLAMVSTPPPLPRSSILTSPVKRLSPEKEASLKSMLEKKPLTVTRAKSTANAGSPLASPSSAETLTRLRDSSRKPPSSLQVCISRSLDLVRFEIGINFYPGVHQGVGHTN